MSKLRRCWISAHATAPPGRSRLPGATGRSTAARRCVPAITKTPVETREPQFSCYGCGLGGFAQKEQGGFGFTLHLFHQTLARGFVRAPAHEFGACLLYT